MKLDKELKNLIIIYGIVSILCIITILIRLFINKDFKFMEYKINKSCNMWCLSHFIMYFFLGLFAPKYWYISFIISIIWEYIEEYLEKFNIYITSNIVNDIITNTIGLINGIILNKLIF